MRGLVSYPVNHQGGTTSSSDSFPDNIQEKVAEENEI
jgi:hypothetical protein